MCLASVKSNMRVSSGKVGKDSGRCKVPVETEPVSRATDFPALISPYTAPFPLCWPWLSFGTWMNHELYAPSCLREEEERVPGFFCPFTDAHRGLQSTSP